MNNTNKVYLKTAEELLQSLLQDEAKNAAILDSLAQTIKQLRAKSSFRLALVNQMIESEQFTGDNK